MKVINKGDPMKRYTLILIVICNLLLCLQLHASFSPSSYPPIPEQPEYSELHDIHQIENTIHGDSVVNSLVELGHKNILALFNIVGQCPDTITLRDEITGIPKYIRCPVYAFNLSDQSMVTSINKTNPNLKPLITEIKMIYIFEGSYSVTLTYKSKLTYTKTQQFYEGQRLMQLPNGFLVPEKIINPLLAKIMTITQLWPEGIVFLWEKCKNSDHPCTQDENNMRYVTDQLYRFGLIDQTGKIVPFVTAILSAMLEKITFDNIDPLKCSAILAPTHNQNEQSAKQTQSPLTKEKI